MDGRERLLEAARALDPVRPAVAFERDLYVEPPDGGAHGRVARWCRRDPMAHQLFLGGIGSGKTTELIKAREEIEREQLAHAWHVELDAYFDLGSPREGMLVTLAGLAMLAALERGGGHIDAALHPPARLLHEAVLVRRRTLPELLRPTYVDPGANAPAMTAATLAQGIEPLVQRWSSIGNGRNGVMLLVDAMDRRPFEDFVAMTREDLPILRRFGVGVVVVGNVDWRHGLDAEQRALFHDSWIQPFYDPAKVEDGAFLRRVLERRAPGVFSARVAERIVEASGGVMRDLLTIAWHVAYEAMDDAAYEVTIEGVERAIESFRDGTLANLDAPAREALDALERDERQPVTSVGDGLQARGCAILRDGAWEVHPAMRSRVARHEAA